MRIFLSVSGSRVDRRRIESCLQAIFFGQRRQAVVAAQIEIVDDEPDREDERPGDQDQDPLRRPHGFILEWVRCRLRLASM